jgi:hypothetical protein
LLLAESDCVIDLLLAELLVELLDSELLVALVPEESVDPELSLVSSNEVSTRFVPANTTGGENGVPVLNTALRAAIVVPPRVSATSNSICLSSAASKLNDSTEPASVRSASTSRGWNVVSHTRTRREVRPIARPRSMVMAFPIQKFPKRKKAPDSPAGRAAWTAGRVKLSRALGCYPGRPASVVAATISRRSTPCRVKAEAGPPGVSLGSPGPGVLVLPG